MNFIIANTIVRRSGAGIVSAPTANFTSNITTVPENGAVNYTDTSNPNGSPITAWLWTFEGGTPSTSTQQNPTVTYAIPGNYQVSLQVTNALGVNTKTVPGYITVDNSQIIADFFTSTTNITEGQSIQYYDSSYGDTATAWNWTFEGGIPATSTDQNPAVNYPLPGSYDVTLQVFDESGSNTKFVPNYMNVANVPIVADFTANDTTPIVDQLVQFTDTSYGDVPAIAWNWTFEGGTPATSNIQNPIVKWNTPGNYDVSLQVFDESGSNTKSVPDYISVSAAPIGWSIDSWNLTTGYNILQSSEIDSEENLMLFRL